VGFEPTVRFPVHSISSAANSTTLAPLQKLEKRDGGEGGIRTHGGLSPTPVFETGALIHYATSPRAKEMLNDLTTFLLKHA
jgi:hypothetical protein